MFEVKKLYEPTIPCFLLNDLEPMPHCTPPKIAVKRGRHHVVRMRSGMRSEKFRELCDDKYKDEEGNLFRCYPINNDEKLAAPLPSIQVTGWIQVGTRRGANPPARRRRGGPNSGRTKCGACSYLGHNVQTCPQRGQPK